VVNIEAHLMIRQPAFRPLTPWLIGLFFIAQICGVARLLSEHTAHVTESQLVFSDVAATGATSLGHHHHYGDADGAIQHHELQDLNGAPAYLVDDCEVTFTHDAIRAYVADLLTGNNPVLLERPPKPFLSV
jgi:hypothetical protein